MLVDAGSGDPETPINRCPLDPTAIRPRAVILTRPVHERFNNADL
jgi:hypothetical protein